ncbi:MAG TPA: prolyl oligopeptidase family serine peptidase [Lacunisphaera sp.]|nr:prolyl oligopeptidase family serine peptidase [Lacunisphaera sp.]
MRPAHATLLVFFLASTAALFAADPVPGKQVEQSFATSDGGSMPYLLYLPENYSATSDKVPVILFLHGRGESYGPLSLVAKWGPPCRLAAGEQMHYLVVSPQCPKESSWDKADQQARLLELLALIKKTCHVDEDRIYLTGMSMGGYGSWRLAADHPEMFAAMVPVCGGGTPADAGRLIKLPIWAWHGTDDPAVPFAQSVGMVEAIKAAGGTRVRFTSLEYIGHFSWQAAYSSNDLYAWLDQQKASLNK